jgi:hypothetical protein
MEYQYLNLKTTIFQEFRVSEEYTLGYCGALIKLKRKEKNPCVPY